MKTANFVREYQVSLVGRASYPANPLERLTETATSNSPAPLTTLQVQMIYRLRITSLPGRKGWYRGEWFDWYLVGVPAQDWKRQASQVSPWYYRVRTDGVVEIAQQSLEPLEHHTLRASALWFLQWVKPAGIGSEWTAQEPYPSGQVVCRYRRESQTRNETVYRKQFLRFVSSPSSSGPVMRIAGELRYAFRNRDGVLLSVEGKVQEQSFSNGALISESVNRVKVRLVHERQVSPSEQGRWRKEVAQLGASTRWRTVVSLPTPEEARLSQARALLGERTVADLMREIRALDDSSPDSPNQEQMVRLQLALEGALILKPQEVYPFAESRLASATKLTPSFWVVLGAISSSERGGIVLLNAFKRCASTEVRLVLMRQMGLISRVQSSLFEQLWRLYLEERDESLRMAMGLTLGVWAGIVLGQGKRSAVEPFLRYVHQQVEEAERREDAQSLHYWLGVTTNTKSLDFLPFWERLARRGTEPIRLAVAEALSSVQHPRVARLLLEMVHLEPSSTVRVKLAQGLCKFWTTLPKVPRVIERLLFGDPDQNVRTTIVDELTKLAAQHSDAMRLLVRASRENSEEMVRRHALIGLASLHAQGIPIPKE